MPEQINDNNPPIGRYILIGLAFVVIFVIFAYLVYRFTQGPRRTSPTPSPTPTIISQGSQAVAYSPALLPPPTTQPVDPRARIYQPQATPARPILTNQGLSGRLIGQDGRGNIIIDGYTLDQRFALEQQRQSNDQAYRVLLEQDRSGLDAQKLASQTQLDTLRIQNERERNQQQLEREQQDKNREQQTKLTLEQLKNQRDLAELQAKSQPTATDQIKLATTQAQFQLEQQREQARQQRLTSNAETANQLALAQQQSTAQLRLNESQAAAQARYLQAQTAAQNSQIDKQTAADLQRLSLQQKQELATLAIQEAGRQQDREFSLRATQLNNDLALLQQAQLHRQTLERIQLESRIQTNLIWLTSRLPRSNYSAGYDSGYNYSPYTRGYPGYY